MKRNAAYPENAQVYIAMLEKELAEKDRKIENLETENTYLQEKLKVALYRRFCRSSEQDKDQPALFNTEELSDDPEEIQAQTKIQTVRTYTRTVKTGRKPLAENIPRVEKIIDISEEEKQCACGHEMVRIGEEVSERLVIIPEKVYVERTVRPKYACHICEGSGDEGHKAVRIAPSPASLIPKSITTPELLSFIITNKFVLHLPYYRQSVHFSEIGADISRQDMSTWQEKAGAAVSPLIEELKKELKAGNVMHMDETPIQVLHEKEKDGEDCRGYMWAATGGRKGNPVVMYEYHPGRQGIYADSYLDGYTGWLQTDGYAGYSRAEEKHPGVRHVLCFVHARRRFFEASKANPKDMFLKDVLNTISELYEKETKLRKQGLESEAFCAKRREACTPVLDSLKQRLELVRSEKILTPLAGKAVSYTLDNWAGLVKYLECADLTPDNNECENAIRPFVVGRKNWLFCGSTEGAESSCVFYSLIETAKRNGVKPYDYLCRLFTLLPLMKTEDSWDSLLPWNIKL